MDRPIGTWLLLWPSLWSMFLCCPQPAPHILALFCVGAVVMRGAGCTVNDM
jgi:4-hydroxybenzoate polyprenyltransferase